ncbi:sigma 54-interacting transcriptional regulator [Bacillus sp. FJAT-45037]|uniref:sigma 54-interacting transcriptional regulator n=1 Tax=Bacillus sp. FJAT-45037 TaxID=2011007 RepID=UPI000C24E104|nr:sigma 54-interacting transcriptional regulator [Bacillus sp. FJAT-45037]
MLNMKDYVGAIERSYEQMEAMIRSLPFGAILTDCEHRILFHNDMFQRMVKKTPEEIKGQVLTSYIDGNLFKGISEGTNIHVTFREHEFILRREETMIRDNKHFVYLISSIKELEDLLQVDREKTELLETVMEFAFDGIVIVDKDGYITMLNKEYAEFIGIDPTDAVGKHVTEVIENTRMHIVAKTGKPEVADLQRINGDYMIATRMPVIKGGEVTGAVGRVLFQNVGGFNSLYKRIKMMETELKKYKGEFREQNKATYTFHHIVGTSESVTDAKHQAERSAQSDSTVLLLGESGTGKELFAHAIHNAGKRAPGSFVKVNCAAIPPDLLESELFGYEDGSFTGAKKGGKKGKFEAADGGTIFLDEIGELPLHMQVKFLRILQEREVEKIGSTTSKPIDVRVIAATNRNLEEMVEKGEFRLDLYYRLNVVAINIPPLRQRESDLVELSHHFMNKLSPIMKKQVEGISKEAQRLLNQYHWPGNIRELENVIERAMNMLDRETVIKPLHLPTKLTNTTMEEDVETLARSIEKAEKAAIIHALNFTKGNRSKAASVLGVSRSTFYEKLTKYGI